LCTGTAHTPPQLQKWRALLHGEVISLCREKARYRASVEDTSQRVEGQWIDVKPAKKIKKSREINYTLKRKNADLPSMNRIDVE
jgi:hypothetical protein